MSESEFRDYIYRVDDHGLTPVAEIQRLHRARNGAYKRAMDLFESLLTEKQKREWHRKDRVTVRGGKRVWWLKWVPRRRWRIKTDRAVGNLRKRVGFILWWGYCAVPISYNMPRYDHYITELLMLQTEDGRLKGIATAFPGI